MTQQRKLAESEIPSFDSMVSAVMVQYALATRRPRLYKLGYYWYESGNSDCQQVVVRNPDYTLKQVIDTVAIISPALPWELNVSDGETVLKAHRDFTSLPFRKAFCMESGVQTPYGYANHAKAWSVLSGTVEFILKRTCYKTWNFGQCLEYPTTGLAVCIDQHIVHILIEDGRKGSVGISAKQYRLFTSVITHCAELLGILPSRLQAIIWVYRQFSLGYMVD